MHRTLRLPLALLVAVTCSLVGLHATRVTAATYTWSAVANGAAGTAANWNPAAVPGSADSCQYILNGQYTVTFGAAVPEVRGQLVRFGGVTLQFPTGSHTTNGRVQVANNPAQPCSLKVADGALVVGNQCYVGAISGTSGTLTFSGGGASGDFRTNQPRFGENAGTGVLAVTGGASVFMRGVSPMFGWSSGHGTLRVSGVDPADAYDRSTFRDSLTVGTAVYFGNQAGDGHAEVLDGALAEFSQVVDFGPYAGSTGSLWVGGAGSVDSARAIFHSSLGIGHGENSNPGGTGTVTCAAGGVIEVNGYTFVGDPDTYSGAKLEIRGGSRFSTFHLYLLDPVHDLDFRGGRLQLTGGTLDVNGLPLTLDGLANTPKLELLNGSEAFLDATVSPGLVVGDAGQAEMHVLGNSQVTLGSFNTIVGDEVGSNGLIEIDGTATHVTSGGDFTIGRLGTGTLNVTGGADADAVSLRIGSQAGSFGNVDVKGAGSAMTLSGGFAVGGTFVAASGGSLANLGITDGGRVTTDLAAASTVWGGGILELARGGVLELNGRLDLRGFLSIGEGSTTGSGEIAPLGSAQIIGYGTLANRFASPVDTTARILAGGPLSLGRSDMADGYDCRAKLEVAAQTLTIADLDSATVGTVTIDGGTLVGPVEGIVLPAGHRLQGTGTIDSKLRASGSVFAEGLFGLTFTKDVIGSGLGLSGTIVRLAPGGGFAGGGVLESNVWVDSAATFRATAPTQVGDFFRVTSMLVDGTLAAAPGVTTNIVCSDTTRVRGTVALEGGAIFPWYAPLHVRGGGKLTGSGGILAPTLVDGRLDPGGAAQLGRIAITGSLVLRSGARTWFDLGSFAAGARDSIVVTGNAQLGGTLDLRPYPGFHPQVGDSFLVISGTSVTGTFANVTVLGQSAAGLFQLRYRPTGVWAVVLVGGLDVPMGGEVPRALRFAASGSPARTLAFALDLPTAADVTAELFDVNGRRVASLQRGRMEAGSHVLRPAQGEVPSGGLYFARVAVREGDHVTTRTARAVLVR